MRASPKLLVVLGAGFAAGALVGVLLTHGPAAETGSGEGSVDGGLSRVREGRGAVGPTFPTRHAGRNVTVQRGRAHLSSRTMRDLARSQRPKPGSKLAATLA